MRESVMLMALIIALALPAVAEDVRVAGTFVVVEGLDLDEGEALVLGLAQESGHMGGTLIESIRSAIPQTRERSFADRAESFIHGLPVGAALQDVPFTERSDGSVRLGVTAGTIRLPRVDEFRFRGVSYGSRALPLLPNGGVGIILLGGKDVDFALGLEVTPEES